VARTLTVRVCSVIERTPADPSDGHAIRYLRSGSRKSAPGPWVASDLAWLLLRSGLSAVPASGAGAAGLCAAGAGAAGFCGAGVCGPGVSPRATMAPRDDGPHHGAQRRELCRIAREPVVPGPHLRSFCDETSVNDPTEVHFRGRGSRQRLVGVSRETGAGAFEIAWLGQGLTRLARLGRSDACGCQVARASAETVLDRRPLDWLVANACGRKTHKQGAGSTAMRLSSKALGVRPGPTVEDQHRPKAGPLRLASVSRDLSRAAGSSTTASERALILVATAEQLDTNNRAGSTRVGSTRDTRKPTEVDPPTLFPTTTNWPTASRPAVRTVRLPLAWSGCSCTHGPSAAGLVWSGCTHGPSAARLVWLQLHPRSDCRPLVRLQLLRRSGRGCRVIRLLLAARSARG
jgi:hypothetical protein